MSSRAARATPSVVVLGAGVAGLACALGLVDAGVPGTAIRVVEAAPRVGGLAASWVDHDGDPVEIGLHLCFDHYERFRALLRRIGAEDAVRWEPARLHYLRDRGRAAVLDLSRGPGPARGLVGVLADRGLSLLDKLRAVPGAAESLLAPAGHLSRYDDISFAAWARRRGLSERLLRELFDPMVRGLSFVGCDEVSAAVMLRYIRRIGRASAARIGYFRRPLHEALGGPATRCLEEAGVSLELGREVASLERGDAGEIAVVLASGERVTSDAVVSTLPPHVLGALLPSHPSFATLRESTRQMPPVAVVSAQVWFEEPVLPFAGVVMTPDACTNTVADVAALHASSGRGSVLSFVLAPAAPWLDTNDERVVGEALAVLARRLGTTLPSPRKAVVVRTPSSIPLLGPGFEGARPGCVTAAPNLLLAGHWIATGHNPNLEGAARSAELVVPHVLRRLAR